MHILKIPLSTPDYSTVVFSDGSSLVFDAENNEICDVGSDGQVRCRALIDGDGSSFEDFCGLARFSNTELRVARNGFGFLEFKNEKGATLEPSITRVTPDEKGKPWLLFSAQVNAASPEEMLLQKFMISIEIALRESWSAPS